MSSVSPQPEEWPELPEPGWPAERRWREQHLCERAAEGQGEAVARLRKGSGKVNERQ